MIYDEKVRRETLIDVYGQVIATYPPFRGEELRSIKKRVLEYVRDELEGTNGTKRDIVFEINADYDVLLSVCKKKYKMHGCTCAIGLMSVGKERK